MAADTLKSLSITNLDASPIIYNTTGAGAQGKIQQVADFVAVTTGGEGSTSSTYKMVRLPSNVSVKAMNIFFSTLPDTNGTPTLSFDVGAYYSDSTTDGTAVANQGNSISATSFASAVLATTGWTKGVKTNVFLNPATNLINQPLWKQIGLSTDPGGQIDVVIAVHATAATAAAATMGLSVDFIKN